jgi:DNA integrity scanning protein DisA with diadenylate cyclase activity
MVSKNSITGDALRTKASNEKYRDNFDKIFAKTEVINLNTWVTVSDTEIKDMTHRDITPWMWQLLRNFEAELKKRNKA